MKVFGTCVYLGVRDFAKKDGSKAWFVDVRTDGGFVSFYLSDLDAVEGIPEYAKVAVTLRITQGLSGNFISLLDMEESN